MTDETITPLPDAELPALLRDAADSYRADADTYIRPGRARWGRQAAATLDALADRLAQQPPSPAPAAPPDGGGRVMGAHIRCPRCGDGARCRCVADTPAPSPAPAAPRTGEGEALLLELEDAAAAFERAVIKGQPQPFVRLQDAQRAARAHLAAAEARAAQAEREREAALRELVTHGGLLADEQEARGRWKRIARALRDRWRASLPWR